jgi:hypothetical protein
MRVSLEAERKTQRETKKSSWSKTFSFCRRCRCLRRRERRRRVLDERIEIVSKLIWQGLENICLFSSCAEA